MRDRRTLAPALAYVILALLVQAGVTAPLDRFALRDLQPLADTNWGNLTAPADSLVATLLFGAGCALLRRRDRRRDAGAWLVALAAGFAVEVAGKELVTQIDYAEHQRVLDVFTLPRSFPSGHAMRAGLLAGLATALWPRIRSVAIVWALTTACLTVAGGMHVPSDVAGGLLVGAALWSRAAHEQARATKRT